MTKEKYLEKLRSKLSILEEAEIDDIIEEYSGYIDEKIKSGKSEKEALKDFGDVDGLAKELLSAYKINQNYSEKKGVEKVVEKANEVIDTIVNYFSNKSFWEIVKIIIEIVIIGLLISLFKIPVELIENILENLFITLPYPLSEIIIDVFNILIEIAFILIAIIFFIKIVEKRYFKGVSMPKKIKEKKSKVREEKPVKEIKEKEEVVLEKKGFLDSASSIVILLIKFMLIILLIPVAVGVIISIIGLILDIYLISKGVFYIGVLLCVIACLVGSIATLEAMIKFIADKKVKVNRFLITLFVSIGILAGGLVVTALELTSANYYDILPEEIKASEVTYKFEEKELENIIANSHINYVVDDTLDEIKVVVKYYEDFNKIQVNNVNNKLFINNEMIYQGKYLSDVVLKDLKSKNFHNYWLLFEYETTVYANQQTIDLLKDNLRISQAVDSSYWYEDYEDLYRADTEYMKDVVSGKEAVDKIVEYLGIRVSEIEDISIEIEIKEEVPNYIVSFEYDDRDRLYKFILDAKTGDIISQVK